MSKNVIKEQKMALYHMAMLPFNLYTQENSQNLCLTLVKEKQIGHKDVPIFSVSSYACRIIATFTQHFNN